MDSTPESCRSKQVRYQLSNPSPFLSQQSPCLEISGEIHDPNEQFEKLSPLVKQPE